MRYFVLILCWLHSSAWATTYYLSPSGNDSYSTAQAQASGTPWKTFSKAFGEMLAADTLLLLDGTYSIAAGTGCINFSGTGCAQPPNGTNTSAMTTIQAVNEGSVFLVGTGAGDGDASGYAIFLGRSDTTQSYIEIRGITSYDGAYLYNTDYCKLKNCGVRGSSVKGLEVGTNDHSDSSDYNLVEDCFVWTTDARIPASIYEGRYNIFRRVVIRADGCGTAACSNDPEVGITIYNSQYCILQNVILIDRLATRYPYADFATAQHTGGANDYSMRDNQWHGCMSINSQDSVMYFEADNIISPTVTITNFVGLNNEYGMAINDCSGCSITGATLIGDVSPAGVWVDWESDSTTRNVCVRGDANYAFVNIAGDYINVYGSWDSNESSSSTITNKTTTDPYTGTPASILYPVRVETGSANKGTGYGGGDIGAVVLKKIGTDGTFYGETGYNTITDNDLWPWPQEDRIKAEMSANYSSTDETRGFCASGKQLNGTDDITLTSYIWEYLGNQIPSDIYGSETPEATKTQLVGSSISGVSLQ